MSHLADHIIFFYSQPEVFRRAGKRPKKILSENSIKNLNKKIGDKYQSDLLNPNGSTQNQSLAARLAELTTNTSQASINSGTNVSRNARGTIFTDTRLQALKFLTEDMLKELEETLTSFVDNEIKPNLPGQIIYDLHSDWSDLTDKCEYKTYPLWQTKNGRDSTTKKSEKGDKKTDENGVLQSESSNDVRKETSSQQGHKKNQVKPNRQGTKLTAISEKSNEARGSRSNLMLRRSSSTSKNLSPNPGQKSRAEMVSRLTHNASVSTGCLVNYQLSSKVYREKGWTVLKIDLDEELLDNERRILTCLKTSLKNIDDVRTYNNRNGLVKTCKLRFYGDNKKEQIEKYKATVLKPKKSMFAMSITRNEIPKPLDINYMLEIMSNPNLASMSVTSSGSAQTNKLIKNLSSVLQLPKPPSILHTQTNDGTTCVFYKNGQLAISLSNVFGYYVDNSSTSNSESRNTLQNMQSSMNSSFNGSNPTGPVLLAQNVRNSYTTVVYDCYKKPPKSASTVGVNSIRLGTITSSDNYDDENFKKIFEKPRKRDEPRLLAVITALGYCVVYRSNGNPKFVCTEHGGCLCNSNGSVNYQWRWDDLRYTDYERFREELSVDLNEFIRLEYKNPSSIKLRFKCEKELMDFDLSSPKENHNRLHDLLNRTVSEFPMKSKLGSLKVIPSAKAPQIAIYKQHHHQQQSNHNNLKASIYLGQSKDSEKTRIDKLLEKTVSYKDVPLIKDLLQIQKKIRSVLEDWLLYCRQSLGILEPNLYILPDFPIRHKLNRFNENHSDFEKIVLHRRKSKSVENFSSFNRFNFDNEITGRNKKKPAVMLKSVDFYLDDEKRSKSAFITRKYGTSLRNQSELLAKFKEFRGGKTKKMIKERPGLIQSKSAIWSSSELNRAKAMSTNRVLSNTFQIPKTSFSFDLETLSTFVTKSSRLHDDLNLMCPFSLHQKLAFDKFDIECRCKKQSVPFICDVEFDYFLRLAPNEQMIAIAVIDSQSPPHHIQFIFSDLYESQNKIRIQPCKESLRDDYRFLFYDLKSAADDSNHTHPLLVTRHNVAPGMVLIYKNSKLVFCDHIFNGYGYSQQDFIKQLEKSKEDAKLEKFLPNNFHFNHPFGKSGRRTAWGGQIVGNEDDRICDSYEESESGRNMFVPKLVVNPIVKREKSTISLPKINKPSVQV